MGTVGEQLGILYEEVSKCTECRSEPAIGKLPADEFRFCWKPFLSASGEPPVAFVFVAMEPTLPRKEHLVFTFPRTGFFSQPLLFAINRFLMVGVHEGKKFLITNAAKCSLNTGTTCDETRKLRFDHCARFLIEEIRQVSVDRRPPKVVAVGREPQRFMNEAKSITGLLAGQEVGYVSHYSYHPGAERYFREYIEKAGPNLFRKFCDEVGPDYQDFLWRKGAPIVPAEDSRDFENPNVRFDLERLFSWQGQMKAIRETA